MRGLASAGQDLHYSFKEEVDNLKILNFGVLAPSKVPTVM